MAGKEPAAESGPSVTDVESIASVAKGDLEHAAPEPSIFAHKSLFTRLSHVVTADTHEAEAKAKQYLAKQAAWATALIEKLTMEEGLNKLPKAVINTCEGLAFINNHKGGLGVSVARGYGFVIKKLSQDTYGNSTWSPPLFFTVSQLGMGLLAGFQHSQSVLALLSFGAIETFKQAGTTMGTDLALFSTDGALSGMSGGAMGHGQQLSMTVDNQRAAFCYSMVDGLFLEISLHGTTISPDGSTNQGLYQDRHTPDEVLEGKSVAAFPEMSVLYRTINMLGRQAMAGQH